MRAAGVIDKGMRGAVGPMAVSHVHGARGLRGRTIVGNAGHVGVAEGAHAASECWKVCI